MKVGNIAQEKALYAMDITEFWNFMSNKYVGRINNYETKCSAEEDISEYIRQQIYMGNTSASFGHSLSEFFKSNIEIK